MFKTLLGTNKPIIAMAHFPPLPDSPQYDFGGGVAKIYDAVYADVAALVANGVDAIMFGNEGDRPYLTKVSPVVPATMAAVISRITAEFKIPFGVDVLWDPIAAIGLAEATGALFVREVFTNAYASDMGLWNTNCGEAYRYKESIGAGNVKLFYNLNAEFAAPLAERPLAQLAKSVVFSSLPDAVCVSGPMTGESAEVSNLEIVKQAVPQTPVLANTGVSIENVEKILNVADGAIVGTSLKRNGDTWSPVDPDRVARLMDVVNKLRLSRSA